MAWRMFGLSATRLYTRKLRNLMRTGFYVQAMEVSVMSRCDLTDRERAAVQPLPPNRPRGVPRVGDRRRNAGTARQSATAGPGRTQGAHFQCLERRGAGGAPSHRQLGPSRLPAPGGRERGLRTPPSGAPGAGWAARSMLSSAPAACRSSSLRLPGRFLTKPSRRFRAIATRCDYSAVVCDRVPPEERVAATHRVVCWRHREIFGNARDL